MSKLIGRMVEHDWTTILAVYAAEFTLALAFGKSDCDGNDTDCRDCHFSSLSITGFPDPARALGNPHSGCKWKLF